MSHAGAHHHHTFEASSVGGVGDSSSNSNISPLQRVQIRQHATAAASERGMAAARSQQAGRLNPRLATSRFAVEHNDAAYSEIDDDTLVGPPPSEDDMSEDAGGAGAGAGGYTSASASARSSLSSNQSSILGSHYHQHSSSQYRQPQQQQQQQQQSQPAAVKVSSFAKEVVERLGVDNTQSVAAMAVVTFIF